MKTVNIIFVVLLGAFAMACDPSYAYLEIELSSSPPGGAVIIDRHGIRLPTGIAVAVETTPVSHTKDYEHPEVTLKSRNQAVFDVRRGPQDSEFVFIGVSPGTTCMAVQVNGHEEECIDVFVMKADQ